jgi:hypothetical protein
LKVNDTIIQREPFRSTKLVVEHIFEGAKIGKTEPLHEVLIP